MSILTVNLPPSDAWVGDVIRQLASRRDQPGMSVSGVARDILKSALKSHRPPSREELEWKRKLDNGWDK